MSNACQIVTLTLNPSVDKSCNTESVFAEAKLRCQQVIREPGGGGLNVARAVHRLGGKALAVWPCGGHVGQYLKSLLDEDGIVHQPVSIQAITRENLTVFEEPSDTQYRFIMPGAALDASELSRLERCLEELEPPPEYLVLSGSLPSEMDQHTYSRIARRVSPPTRVVLDASGPSLKKGIDVPIYLIKPNVRELAQLAGHDIEGDAQIRQAAQGLIADGRVQVVVTSLGSAGAALVTADTYQRIAAPTVKIRSKVGAGDSMVAGIVLALCRGHSISEATCRGVAAGAAAVMTEGTELCRQADAERLYDQMCVPETGGHTPESG